MIEKESDIFVLLFIGDGATISRVPQLKHFGFRKKSSSSRIRTHWSLGPLIRWWGKEWNLYM